MTHLCLIGDIHLSTRHERNEHMLEMLDWVMKDAENHVSATDEIVFVFMGDIFEEQPTGSEYASLIRRIFGERSAFILGNHEALDALKPLHYITTVADDSCVSLSYEDINVLLIPYPRRGHAPFDQIKGESIQESLTKTAEAIASIIEHQKPDIVLGHFTVEGMKLGDSKFERHTSTEVLVPQSAFKNVKLAAVGHIHSPQDVAPNIIGVGSLIRHTFAEKNDQKSYTLVTIDQGSVTWGRHHIPCRKQETLDFQWRPGLTFGDRLIQQCKGKEVRVRCTVREDQLSTYDESVFKPLNEAAVFFQLDRPKVVPIERPRAPEISGGISAYDAIVLYQKLTKDVDRGDRLVGKVAEITG